MLLLANFDFDTETFPSIGRVRVRHRGILLMLKGTVIRSGAVKMYEGERMYRCRKCKHMYDSVLWLKLDIMHLSSLVLVVWLTELVSYIGFLFSLSWNQSTLL